MNRRITAVGIATCLLLTFMSSAMAEDFPAVADLPEVKGCPIRW